MNKSCGCGRFAVVPAVYSSRPASSATSYYRYHHLSSVCHRPQELHLYVEMVANSMFGNGPPDNNIQPPDENKCYKLKTVRGARCGGMGAVLVRHA